MSRGTIFQRQSMSIIMPFNLPHYTFSTPLLISQISSLCTHSSSLLSKMKKTAQPFADLLLAALNTDNPPVQKRKYHDWLRKSVPKKSALIFAMYAPPSSYMDVSIIWLSIFTFRLSLMFASQAASGGHIVSMMLGCKILFLVAWIELKSSY